jgi:hypothetical protein
VTKTEVEGQSAEDRTTKRVRASRWGYASTEVKNDDEPDTAHQATSDLQQDNLSLPAVSPPPPEDMRPQDGDDEHDYDMPLVAIKRVPSRLGGSIKISISKASLDEISAEDLKSTVVGSGVGQDTPTDSSTKVEAGGSAFSNVFH